MEEEKGVHEEEKGVEGVPEEEKGVEGVLEDEEDEEEVPEEEVPEEEVPEDVARITICSGSNVWVRDVRVDGSFVPVDAEPCVPHDHVAGSYRVYMDVDDPGFAAKCIIAVRYVYRQYRQYSFILTSCGDSGRREIINMVQF